MYLGKRQGKFNSGKILKPLDSDDEIYCVWYLKQECSYYFLSSKLDKFRCMQNTGNQLFLFWILEQIKCNLEELNKIDHEGGKIHRNNNSFTRIKYVLSGQNVQ